MRSHPFYVYIVECNDKSFYTGITDNLELRIKEHNGELKGGAKYTRSKRPVKLIHTETFKTHLEAVRREVKIKGMTRVQKQKLFWEK